MYQKTDVKINSCVPVSYDLSTVNISNQRSQIQSILNSVQERRIAEISPDWVESISITWKDKSLHADIALSAKPPPGTVMPFLSLLEQESGCRVTRSISPGESLIKDTAPRQENIRSRDKFHKMISHTLPEGVEVYHVRYFMERIGDEVVEFLIPQLSGIKGKEDAIENWRKQFEDNYGIEVYPKNDWVSSSIKNILRNELRKNHNISADTGTLRFTSRDIPVLKKLFRTFHSPVKQPGKPDAKWQLDESKLVDLSGEKFTWITLDSVSTRNREDALCARMTAQGRIEVYIALNDPSSFAPPGSLEDLRVQRRGVSIYGRKRTIPTLSHQAANDFGSFVPGETRRAVVTKFIFESDGSIKDKTPEIIWAKIKCVGNIEPELVHRVVSTDISLEEVREQLAKNATKNDASRARVSLYWLAQITPGLKGLLTNSTGPHTLKGQGLGHQLVQYSMLACKHSLAKFLKDNEYGFIANNQGIRDAKFIHELQEDFDAHSISFSEADLSDPKRFKAIHQLLIDLKFERLRDKFLLARIGKTTFSPIVRGKEAMNLDVYANFKARMSDGLTNIQIVVALLNGLPAPYSFKELLERAKNAERKHSASRPLSMRLLAFESIYHHLKQIGEVFPFTVKALAENQAEIAVKGNNRRCILTNVHGDLSEVTGARLKEYVMSESDDYYVFEPVYDRRRKAA